MTCMIGETAPDVIAAFMQQIIVEYHAYGRVCQRSEPRESMAVPIVVHPLSANLQPQGSPLHAITRDLSYGGIGFFHKSTIEADYVRLLMQSPETHEQMQLLARIEHQTKCGGFYIIGCRFAHRPDAAESSPPAR